MHRVGTRRPYRYRYRDGAPASPLHPATECPAALEAGWMGEKGGLGGKIRVIWRLGNTLPQDRRCASLVHGSCHEPLSGEATAGSMSGGHRGQPCAQAQALSPAGRGSLGSDGNGKHDSLQDEPCANTRFQRSLGPSDAASPKKREVGLIQQCIRRRNRSVTLLPPFASGF